MEQNTEHIATRNTNRLYGRKMKLFQISFLVVIAGFMILIGSCVVEDEEIDLNQTEPVLLHDHSQAYGTNEPLILPRTRVIEMTSDTGIDYVFYIGLPRSYEKSDYSYPVVYMLDADYSFPVVRGIVDHLSDRDDLQELILVGISYPDGIEGDGWLRRYRINRTRDYTPTSSSIGYPDGVQDFSGYADDFIAFLRTSVVPFIDDEYRTIEGDRTIIGHSYGGLFSLYVTLNDPRLFSRTISVSPSIWYADRFLFDYEQSRREEIRDFSMRIFLSAGSKESKGWWKMTGNVESFSVLLSQEYPNANVKYKIFNGESHNTIFPVAITEGLLGVFGRVR